MEANVLGVVSETRASNATKEEAAEGVDVNRISSKCICAAVFFRGLGGPAGRFC